MEKIEEGVENVNKNSESRSRSSSEHSSDSVICGKPTHRKVLHSVPKYKEKHRSIESKSVGSLSGVEEIADSVVDVATYPREFTVGSKNNQSNVQNKLKSRQRKAISSTSSTSEALERSDDDVLERTSYSSDSAVTSSRHSQDSLYRISKGKIKDTQIKSRASSLTGVLEELEDDILDVETSGSANNLGFCNSNTEHSTSERVFVQSKKGFEPITKDQLFESKPDDCEANQLQNEERRGNISLVFAIFVYKWSMQFSSFCHGILAGFGLCHVSLVLSLSDNPQSLKTFAESYPDFCRMVQILYYLLSAICLLSVLDRCDIAGLNIHDCGFIFRYRLANVVSVILYFLLLVITVVAVRWDDRFALSPYNEDLWKHQDESKEEFSQWRVFSLLRGILAIFAYALMFLGPHDDMFYESLSKPFAYDETERSSQDLLQC